MLRRQTIPSPAIGLRGAGFVPQYDAVSLRWGLRHYLPGNDGPPSSKGSSTGHIADMVTPTGYGVINSNTTTASWKWGRWGSKHLFTNSPVTRWVLNGTTTENYTNWSISAWIYVTTFAHVNLILSHGTVANNNRYFWVDQTSPGKLGGAFSVGGVFKIALSTILVVVNRWTHVASSYDGANIALYINGVRDSLTPFVFTPESVTSGTTIGAVDTSGTNGFDGYIAHVAEWNRALKYEEVKLLWSNPLVLYPLVSVEHPREALSLSPGGGRAVVAPVAYGGTGSNGNVASVSTNYAMGLADEAVLVTGTNTIVLPTAAEAGEGRVFTIKLTSTTGSPIVTVSVLGGGTIDGVPFINITTTPAVRLISDGSNYWTV